MTALDDRPSTGQTTADLLLQWDQRRPRSQQRELGMSEIGGCRRRAGYVLAGQEPTDSGGSVQAVMGTAVHAAVETVYHDMQAAGLLPEDDLVEHEVRFAGILGHLDRFDSLRQRVTDTKTTSDRWLTQIILNGPTRAHRWQISLYTASLIRAGYTVRDMAIEYLARDTGRTHQVVMQFNPQDVRDALEWLRQVRELPLDMLARDYTPDSAFCTHCPYRSVCWGNAVPDRDPRSVLYVEHPDGAAWARKLEQARADKKAAAEREAEAKGALDALRPDGAGTSDPVDVGHGKLLQWRVSTSHKLDADTVRAEYEAAGARPPENVTESVSLVFVAREQS